MPVLASGRRFAAGRGHPLDAYPCPVCDGPLGDQVTVLIFAGIAPEDRKGHGFTTGGAVAVHADCAGVDEEEPEASPRTVTSVTDDLSAILAEYAERERLVAMGHVRDPKDVPRLLAAVEAALEHHKPVQIYGTVEDYRGKVTCGHDEGDDRDLHFEADDGLWYCTSRPTVRVCSSCCDESDADLRAAWPCPTYAGIARELTGKG